MRQNEYFLTIGISMALFFLLGAPLKSGAETSYTMVCRGGGPMVGHYVKSGPENHFYIYFVKSRFASSVRPPEAGECTWVDRPINRSEPHNLFLDLGSRHHIAVMEIRFDRMRLKHAVGRELDYLIKSIQSTGLFYVRCHNSQVFINHIKQDAFTITRIGP